MEKEKTPDSEVKKRGRPRKQEPIVTNEEQTRLSMAQKQREIEEGVGKVVDAPEITLSDVSSRWKNIFAKYGSMGFEGIRKAWTEATGMLNNPYIQNERIKNILPVGAKVNKEELQKALEDPMHSEQVLRELSVYLYYTNFIYQSIININRDTPKFNYYFHPLYVEDKDKKTIVEESQKVDKILKAFDPKLTFKTISGQVFTEGKASYLVRTSFTEKDVNFLLLQKLKSNNVKLVSLGSRQQFIAAFNMTIFLEPGNSVKQYPEFIQKAWEEMNDLGIIKPNKRGKLSITPLANLPQGHILEHLSGDKYLYWVTLPQDLCYTFYSNGMHAGMFPDEIGLLDDFLSLTDYQWLQGSLLSKGVNSILTGTVPLAYQPKAGADQTAISVDAILGFTDLFGENVAANVWPFFAPFTDYKLHTLNTDPESLNVVYSRIRDLLASSGLSGLVTLSDKPSISSVQTARMLQEAKVDYLTRQYEHFLNNVINSVFGLKLQWQITVHAGIFNWREDASSIKSLVTGGQVGLLPRLLSYFDQSLEDYKGSTLYVESLGIEIFPPTEVKEEKKVGRPKLPADQIQNDNTGISADMGNNVSEIKEYVEQHLTEEEEEL